MDVEQPALETLTPLRDVRRFVHRYARGQSVFRAGDPGHCLYVVTRGAVELHRADSAPGAAPLHRVEAGETFGEIALLEGGLRSASAVAASDDTELAEIDKARFVYLVSQQPAFALTVMRGLARRLRALDPHATDAVPGETA